MELRYETLWLWAPDFQRPAVIGAKIGRTLDAFTRIDPLLGRWTTGHPTERVGPALDPMEIDRTLLVEEGVWLDDWGRPDPEPGGYYWWSWTGGTDLATVATPRTATFQVKAGSKFRNFCVFAIGGGFPKPSDLGVVTYPLYSIGHAGDAEHLARSLGLRQVQRRGHVAGAVVRRSELSQLSVPAALDRLPLR